MIQPHTCLHAVMEMADDGEHSRRHAKTSKDIPQKGSVDGVICFGEVAQVPWGVLPRHFLKACCTTSIMPTVERWVLSQHSSSGKNILAFAVLEFTTAYI